MPRSSRILLVTAGLALLAGGLLVLSGLRCRRAGQSLPALSPDELRRLAAHLGQLEARENAMSESVWAKELLAQQYGRTFEELWDRLNASTDKFGILRAFSFGELIRPRLDHHEQRDCGLNLFTSTAPGTALTTNNWQQSLRAWQSGGWEIAGVEFRHNAFDCATNGQPARSTFYFLAHLSNATEFQRAVLEGDLLITWDSRQSPDELPIVGRIDASQVQLRSRSGSPPFQQVLFEEVLPPDQSFFIDPLILYDLDGDGLSEILLVASNLLFKRRSWEQFEQQPLCRRPPGLIFTAVVADFDGDAAPDLLVARFEGLFLFKGSPQGGFDQPEILVWRAEPKLKYGQVLTCGDVDGDGDLDVWLGQYKGPFQRGQMPTPYYDANDGNPAYLLLNDGRGNLADHSEQAGLAKKRWRRSYSGSFADLDGDGDLDLLVVSDFAGVDLYLNDGRGHFTEATAERIPERRAFGMAHFITDFNADGFADFLVLGMHCPTAQRLDHLGLTRPGFAEQDRMRSAMTRGNLLYLGEANGRFHQQQLSASIARSGWSWGCSAFDFDNNGFPDVYIANGHETKQSVRDYEPEFWLHDIYVGASRDDLVAAAYFSGKSARTRGRGQSYGGYEKNRFYLNAAGGSFIEAGHLFGVAVPEDSRNVVADDLDADGRVDLLVTTFEVWPRVRQTLRVFRNCLEPTGNWIGFRFREQGPALFCAGTTVTLRYAGKTVVRQLVTGDSHRSQHSNTLHFGLGAASSIDSIEVRWTSGKRLTLDHPRINAYYTP
jgi:hypothetical protein